MIKKKKNPFILFINNCFFLCKFTSLKSFLKEKKIMRVLKTYTKKYTFILWSFILSKALNMHLNINISLKTYFTLANIYKLNEDRRYQTLFLFFLLSLSCPFFLPSLSGEMKDHKKFFLQILWLKNDDIYSIFHQNSEIYLFLMFYHWRKMNKKVREEHKYWKQ